MAMKCEGHMIMGAVVFVIGLIYLGAELAYYTLPSVELLTVLTLLFGLKVMYLAKKK